MLNVQCLRSFDCVHSDVWGPYIPRICGNKWFLLFVDVYIHFTWLYITKSKAKILALTIQLCKMVKNQFEVSIKRFRIDHGIEFVNSTIATYFKAEGILHKLACVNAPQHNSLAKRKICHILATTRSFLYHA